jgi:L-idonate 5-dehydrogenase
VLAAAIYGAGDLRLGDWPEPVPGHGEVLVRLRRGGICGSDLAYYRKGAVGDFALREPLVLGHEVAGEIEAVGDGVAGLAVGQRVAVDPSRPCLGCANCRRGRSNLCSAMRFFGSAAVFPHVAGGFSEVFSCRADQCHVIPDSMDYGVAAMAEPLAVALHGIARAGTLVGQRVLVTGAGPIGMLVLLAARRAGAAFVAMTDLVEQPLALARQLGADAGLDLSRDPDALKPFEADGGYFDVALEATGSPAALAGVFKAVRAGGRVVQLGMMPGGDTPVPVNRLMAREIDFVGAFRFAGEFAVGVDYLARGLIDVRPLISRTLPMTELEPAFQLAGDRRQAIKVHLQF